MAVSKKKNNGALAISSEFFDNFSVKSTERITYKGANLNTPTLRKALLELLDGMLDATRFARFFVDGPQILTDQEFLFRLTSVAKFNFDFEQYSKLIHVFSSWNEVYGRIYRAERMFKNMILQRRIGKHYPIHSPEELKRKLKLFNKVSGLCAVSYLDILDCASKDLILNTISAEEYIKVVHPILKCADKSFEKIICRRARNTLLRIGDIRRAQVFI